MLYFIRHGESVANLEKTFAGSRVDSPLTEIGRGQARQVAKVILDSGIIFDTISSSPLSRAHETAKIVARNINFKGTVEIDKRIQEYDMGSISGTKYPLIEDSSIFTSSVDAEKPIDLKNRINEFFNSLKNKDEIVLMVLF